MKKTTLLMLAAALTAGSVWAQTTNTVTATDGSTGAYGACVGFLIDFNANGGADASWTPALVSGVQYSLNSISIKSGATGSATDYLGVYYGNVGGVAGTGQGFSLSSLTFLGASENAINFATAPTLTTWLQYNFSGINVTADSVTPGTFTGSGTLLFVYQPINTAESSWQNPVSTIRFNATSTIAADSLSQIYGNNNWASQRAPQYEASVTAVPTPEPGTMALAALGGASLLFWRRRSK
jgi:PEP-CTERM motif